jgi:hypothetical protein
MVKKLPAVTEWCLVSYSEKPFYAFWGEGVTFLPGESVYKIEN